MAAVLATMGGDAQLLGSPIMTAASKAGTKPIRDHAAGIRVVSVELAVIDGPARGTRTRIVNGLARVGSAPGNHLVLSDPTVSRVHCELRLQASSVSIRDCGSTNGTFVEGVRLTEGEVPPGTCIRVGNSVLRIESAAGDTFLPVSSRTSFGELVGQSLQMRAVYAILERVADTASTVLVQGETGTGKDVVARSLHAHSGRADGPFVPVDCSAIPDSLFESELFGHTRGAFSGALHDRRGVFEEADGGTLFLDEIGEMPLALQPKLLRALETRTVRRVGENRARPVDVRVVAATNRSLASAANQGLFREDLYYRLAVVEVQLPSLRSRSEDIPLLAQHFYAGLVGPEAQLPQAFVDRLAQRHFPGNVRELRNFVERHHALGFIEPGEAAAAGDPASVSGLAGMVPLDLPLKEARQAWTQSFESVYVRSILQKTGGNLSRAAQLAGVNRRFLQRLIVRLGLCAEDFRGADAPRDDDEPE